MFLLFATARSPFWMPRHGLVFGRSKYSTSVFKSSGLSSSWYAHCLWRMCEWCKGMDWCNQLFFDPVNVALTLSLKFHDTVKIIDHRILKKKLKWKWYLSNDPMLSVCRKFVTRDLVMSFRPKVWLLLGALVFFFSNYCLFNSLNNIIFHLKN